MQIYKIYPAGFASNSYLLTADGKNAVVIDAAQPRVLEESVKHGLTVRYVLLTHGHFDHIGGCAALQAAGAEVGCPEEEVSLVFSEDNLATEMGGVQIPPFKVDFTVRDGQQLSLCGMKFAVIKTAGHTAGGACYLVEGNLFTGDTLFAGGVGRTDLPTGSATELRRSLQRLFALSGDIAVFPGHGEDTVLEAERKNGFYRL